MVGNRRAKGKGKATPKATQLPRKRKTVSILEVLLVETVTRIVELLDIRKPNNDCPSKELLALCRTSRSLNAIATGLVYRHFDMGNELRCQKARPFSKLSLFTRTLSSSRALAGLVKSMTLEWRPTSSVSVNIGTRAIDDLRKKDPELYSDLTSYVPERGLEKKEKLANYFRYLVQRLIPCAFNLESLDMRLMSPMPAAAKDAYWDVLDCIKPRKHTIPSLGHVSYAQVEAVDAIVMWRFLHGLGRIAPGIKHLDLDVDMAFKNTHAAARSPQLFFPALIHLNIGQSMLFMEPDLQKLLSSCSGLQSFTIDKVRNVNGEKDPVIASCVVDMLRPHCQTLKVLTIDLARDKPSDNGCLEDSLKAFTELEHLELRANHHIEAEVERLVDAYRAHQKRYSLGEHGGLSDAVLRMVGKTEYDRLRWTLEM
ncbi:hypothetical protein CPLU01_05782 [Colletotrichum plurivorum]|uniref:Uncharacterized protein n=1 Tax=Colletotrichum plurivorum TaxID=2175906 RepID=A0A8H6NHI9_9PEZI|nr:hypothetical protein CPLU01_05782 [Colletotrichum plurivorum]